MMDKNKLKKLLESNNKEDVLVGLNLMVGMSIQDIAKLFEVNGFYSTIARSPIMKSRTEIYKISESCCIFLSDCIFPTLSDYGPTITIDLTK